MVCALMKLILSIGAGALWIWQRKADKPVASLFCFILCALLFLAFILDLVSLIRRKHQAKAHPSETASPAADDYPDNPDPAELKIGKTFRAAEVNHYLSSIQSLAIENPDYQLSESEIIDNYLTDKKIWKYDFKPKDVRLQLVESNSIGIFVGEKQIGCMKNSDCPSLIDAVRNNSVEVVYCTIGGGPYKMVQEDIVTGKYSMITNETNYSVTLSIYEK